MPRLSASKRSVGGSLQHRSRPRGDVARLTRLGCSDQLPKPATCEERAPRPAAAAPTNREPLGPASRLSRKQESGGSRRKLRRNLFTADATPERIIAAVRWIWARRAETEVHHDIVSLRRHQNRGCRQASPRHQGRFWPPDPADRSRPQLSLPPLLARSLRQLRHAPPLIPNPQAQECLWTADGDLHVRRRL